MTVDVEAAKSAAPADRTPGAQLRIESLMLESRGWSSGAVDCAPKIAALASLAALPEPEPVARVTYQSRGNLLVIAGLDAAPARAAAQLLCGDLPVTVLERDTAARSPAFTTWSGELEALGGHLGDFTAQVALAGEAARAAKFDLVLDFSETPALAMRFPPQGYWRGPVDDAVLAEIRGAVGEFEKPRFFAYRENLCAHSRSGIEGCNACIDACATQAISSDGDRIRVDPHLCMGCGTCSTVCPSGAIAYQFPRIADRGAQVKRLLAAYRDAGGAEATILFHDGGAGRALLSSAAATGRGLPAAVLPLETWSIAAVGLDVLLPAIAFGASRVAILAAGNDDPEELAALRHQMEIGQAVLAGLGYGGRHLAVIEAKTPDALAATWTAPEPAAIPAVPATFLVGNDKRTAIEFAVEHLVRHAPSRVEEIALPAGSPFGEIRVDQSRCTMCMACVGACPESALMDGVDVPLLKFLERNCVQCGLCEATCPEEAIALSPRLLLTPAVREARVLNQTQPFHCVSCNKPFGTRQMVEAMTGRLASHSMFAGSAALRRLQMCADCRVVDMMKSKDEVSVLRLGSDA